MKIVIVGGGKVGETLCQELSEKNDVILIDSNLKVVDDIFSQYDIQVLVGNGANVEIQREATVPESEVFIAVTSSDEINIMACILAKSLGAKHTIARVRNPEYHSSVDYIKSALGITAMINPEKASADAIMEIIKFPSALSIESFGNGKISLVKLSIDENSHLDDMTLKEFRIDFDGKLLVCIVERDNGVFIPSGDDKLLSGDVIHITGSMKDLERFYRRLRKYSKPINSVLIIGAGRLSYYLTKELVKRDMRVKVIEINEKRALDFSETFPQIMVINEDGTNQDILEDEGISEYDACIALTGIDEENIIITLFAKHCEVKKTITKVNRTSILKLLDKVGIDTIITPKQIIADKILRFVRSIRANSDSAVQKLYKLADRHVEALEFIASKNSSVVDINLKDLKVLDNTLIAAIIRGSEVIYPDGNDTIKVGDKVIVITLHQSVVDLDDIIKRR